jgi:hypothetical protein
VPFLIGLSRGRLGDDRDQHRGAYTEGLVARKDSGINTFADLKESALAITRDQPPTTA